MRPLTWIERICRRVGLFVVCAEWPHDRWIWNVKRGWWAKYGHWSHVSFLRAMDHATLSITAPSKDPDSLGGSPGSLHVLSSSSQPHDQIHVLVQSLPELLGGGSLGGLEVLEMDGRLSLMESLSDVLSLCDRDSLMESLPESLALPEWL